MKITDEKLSAFLDGELAPEESTALRKAIDADSALKVRLETLGNADKLITAAYGAIDQAPMPESVTAMLETAPRGVDDEPSEVVTFPVHRRTHLPRQWAMPLAASIALAIGIGLGVQFGSGLNGRSGDNFLLAGAIDPQSQIHGILETGRSAELVWLDQDQGASMTPVLAFKSATGEYCREFKLSADGRSNRAVACRESAGWMVRLVTADDLKIGAPDTYASASARVAAAFDAAVDGMMANPPINAEEEKALIENAWQD